MIAALREHPLLRLLRALARPIDPALALVLALLMTYAVVVMASASPERLGSQILHISLALAGAWIVAFIPAQRLLSLAPILYVAGVALLVMVMLFGVSAKGGQRWLDIGVTRIQPSELMKIAMPMMLAWFFQKREGHIGWREFFAAILLLAVPVGMIARQPDMGTSVLVAAAGIYVCFFAGLSWKLIVPAIMAGIAGIAIFVAFGDSMCQPDVSWRPIMRDYQKQRVCTLRDPYLDPLGDGFHTIQSTIAIGSGGLTGKGWMQGTQTHLDFLPEHHTDFIFAVLSEEFGFAGALALLALYAALLLRGFYIAAMATTLGARLLAGAMTMIFFTYVFVNVGMVSGILPVVGVPLPFVSYGGTALVTLSLGVGILMSIHNNRRVERE
ncbi:MAG: rod shape-determining protein RodA [Azoarcus sp.]|jgi:rod shape determining protein RodA|nr:rod shape-determining protein RodA [Azoarcus sp.]